MLKGRKLGFWLAFVGGLLALAGAAAYLIAYATTADPVSGVWDRVFKWLVFGLMAGGGAVALLGEWFRIGFAPILAGGLMGVGLAAHLVETAYPIADVLTRVPFFGGSLPLAMTFTVIFAAAVLLTTAAAFMEHNQSK
ncbi:MAG: hypothetical protein J6Z23_01810 [Lachnospiraceae bacterium]|nr:hypothetical protein [Lachnospiraceae bacterium]